MGTSFCVVGDDIGNAVTYQGGVWSKPVSILPTVNATFLLIRSISCPTENFCAAIGIGVEGVVTTFDGEQWSTPTQLPNVPEAEAVSCTDSQIKFCVAVGGNGAISEISTYNGENWKVTKIVKKQDLEAVSCATQNFCVATGDSGVAMTYNGVKWSAPKTVDSPYALTSVSCPSPSFCSAVDSEGNALIYKNRSWSQPKPVDSDWVLSSVSCSDSNFCAAGSRADPEGYAAGNLVSYDGNLSVTQTSESYENDSMSVACPSEGTCFAVGGGDLFTLGV